MDGELEERAFELLGGSTVFRNFVGSSLDAHDMLVTGMPPQALEHLIESVDVLSSRDTFETVMGMSRKTFRRHVNSRSRLTAAQGGRAWRFARILAKATETLGDQESAEAWLLAPTPGLDNRRPVDLLASSAGVRAVEKHLTKLEHGVYV
ncbi:type II RES/Xre toxin-antitoxin system antitoxin [Citreimonas salinaria]|uniref:Putative toxin-antitoxin system antitoxin component, TIGR02293 family n=1 Tax=Citreimonas salinaria TaxID=321339 RepID=A0A1H3M0F4_9RHOB|nr:antitoxin Xre/MbcA/ParS toxin-binding domain-containing protein [Citreimonas salinaria]SDY69764.1 putative toxin-antitoxin system antitoxin component, TIGR02293 family [Citreimonas salinaria]